MADHNRGPSRSRSQSRSRSRSPTASEVAAGIDDNFLRFLRRHIILCKSSCLHLYSLYCRKYWRGPPGAAPPTHDPITGPQHPPRADPPAEPQTIIENSFGILAARWRIFRKPIIAEPAHAVLYTQAAIALHNYLRSTESSSYCPPGYVDGEDGTGSVIEGNWRSELSSGSGSGLESIGNVGSNRYICCMCRYYYKCNICYRYSRDAAGIRDLFKDFFSSSNGEAAWQYNYVRRTS